MEIWERKTKEAHNPLKSWLKLNPGKPAEIVLVGVDSGASTAVLLKELRTLRSHANTELNLHAHIYSINCFIQPNINDNPALVAKHLQENEAYKCETGNCVFVQNKIRLDDVGLSQDLALKAFADKVDVVIFNPYEGASSDMVENYTRAWVALVKPGGLFVCAHAGEITQPQITAGLRKGVKEYELVFESDNVAVIRF